MNIDRLKAFADAWSNKNLPEIMSYFAQDCEYYPSVYKKGNDHFKGKSNVETAIKEILDFDNTSKSSVSDVYVRGNFGFWKWEYVNALNETTRGCDSFEFRNNLIASKNAFRKIEMNEGSS